MMQQTDDMACTNAQMQADITCNSVQMQVDMACNSTQMLAHMVELENQNQELCEEVATCNSQLPILKGYVQMRQPVSLAAHSAWFASHTPDH
jgi:hypothetical protein